MNIVDTPGWLEYLADSPLAGNYAAAILHLTDTRWKAEEERGCPVAGACQTSIDLGFEWPPLANDGCGRHPGRE